MAVIGGEMGGSFRGVARHGLVEEDVFVGFRLAVERVVGVGEDRIIERNGICALHDNALGRSGDKLRVIDCDVGGGIDGRGALSVGGVGAASDVHGAAAPVASDGSGGIALRLHRQIGCVERAAACDHNAA